MSCTTRVEEIYQGESLTLAYWIDGVATLDDWECYLQITDAATYAVTGVSREITSKATVNSVERFVDIVTSAETLALTPKNYVVTAQLTNPLTGEGVVKTTDIKILRSRIIV